MIGQPMHCEHCYVDLQVFVADVATVISWNPAGVDDDAENGEANASSDLDDTQDELDLHVLLGS